MDLASIASSMLAQPVPFSSLGIAHPILSMESDIDNVA
jgi:hypothetical protein